MSVLICSRAADDNKLCLSRARVVAGVSNGIQNELSAFVKGNGEILNVISCPLRVVGGDTADTADEEGVEGVLFVYRPVPEGYAADCEVGVEIDAESTRALVGRVSGVQRNYG